MAELGKMNAELRMNEILNRIDQIGNQDPSSQNLPSDLPLSQSSTDTKNFAAMVSMMQSQMMGEALVDPDSKDSKNPLESFFPGQSSQNPFASLEKSIPGFSMDANPISPALMQLLSSSKQSSFLPSTAMVEPIKGARISSDYGKRDHPISGHDHFHSGVDFAAAQGTAIRMPWQGKVVFVGEAEGFGKNTVIVAHENQIQTDGKIVYSVFGHNEHAFVKVGEMVQAGEIFATVGSEGHSTGPHLHWETRVARPGVWGKDIFENKISYTVNPMNFQDRFLG